MTDKHGITREIVTFGERVTNFITGRANRDYRSFAENTQIRVSGRDISLGELTRRYALVLYVDARLGNMRPLRILYDAVAGGENLMLINYFVFWPDEIHPNPFTHLIYREFRKLFYGSAEDIEFIQIVISIETGDVVRVAFERDPSGRHDHPSPRHELLIASRKTAAEAFYTTGSGRTVHGSCGAVAVAFDGKRAKILTGTWNHIHELYSGEGDLIDDPHLEYMTDEMYRKYCMARRSKPPL